MIFELYTAYPPSVNNYYVKTQRGIFISQKGKKFRSELLDSVHEQLAGFEPISGKVCMTVVAFVPDRRVRDMDNIQKPLLDAMTKAELWDDDCQVDQIFVYRGAVHKGGMVYIRVDEGGPIIPVGSERLV